MLTEKILSECWDTLEIIWDGVSFLDLSPIVGPVPLREIDHIRPPPWQTQPEAGN